MLLLVTLIILGGAGSWLYVNWEKAESIFLNLDNIGISESNYTSHSQFKQDSRLPESSEFIFELMSVQ